MRYAGLWIIAVVLATGCSADDSGQAAPGSLPEDALAIVTSTDLGAGPGRVLVAIASADGRRLGSPDQPIAIEVAPADQPDMRQRADGTFTWIIEGAFGLYRASFVFDQPGTWQATIVPGNGEPLEPTFFTVRDRSFAPAVGDRAPLVVTPTISTADLASITTDPEPDPAFYTTSLDAAVLDGTTVAVFSTPAFCRTATCGPVLDQVKDLAPSFSDVSFVHIEVYTGFDEPDFIPDGTHLSPAVGPDGWNLPSEPWVFVIQDGIVTHRFEGVLAPSELTDALAG